MGWNYWRCCDNKEWVMKYLYKTFIILLILLSSIPLTGGCCALGEKVDLSFNDVIDKAPFDARYDLRGSAGRSLSYFRTSDIEKRIYSTINGLDSFLIFEKINENEEYYNCLIIDLSSLRLFIIYNGKDGILNEELANRLKTQLEIDYKSDLTNYSFDDGNFYFITCKQKGDLKQIVAYEPEGKELSGFIKTLLRIMHR